LRQRGAPFIAGLVLLAGLVGCRATTPVVEPPVAPPTSFTESGTAAVGGRWWEGFGDAELNRLMTEALDRNFSLRSAWDRLNQADARRRSAGASLWPSLDARAGSEYAWTQARTDSGPDIRSSRRQSIGLAAEYELDLWGRLRASRQAASLDQAVSAEDLRTAAITLSSTLVSTWFELVEQRGQLDLLTNQTNINQKTLGLLEQRLALGQSESTDVLQQRQLVESRREDSHRAEARVRALELELAVLLGRPSDRADFPTTGTLAALPPLPPTGAPSELLQQRPDVRAAFLSVQAADQRVAAAVADRYPRVSLVASYDTSSGRFSSLFDNWVASFGGNLAAPILDGGARKAEVARTRAVASERLNNYGQRIVEALAEVETALSDEARFREVVQSIESQLATAKDVRERTLSRYLSGTETYLRVLDAQLSEQALERELLSARLDLLLARVQLCRALAGGWEMTPPATEPTPKNQYPLPL